ncbi:LOW QUALITY PROTEIN: COMM domain-containing protein 6-like [Haliotis rubra]|uniref:LOW QUALITY PROTEIN: COMM domain-containing protein 6-like n=1 Tax=Haliotis rubra TaxID=36100 RepID=UPI001EE59385|nr:LOW QUALITY PROTEIN: COMM domain-containing protein 6-like [Haliotis rubra]
MAAILQSLPQGFQEAITDASQLPQDMLAQICQDVSTFLQYKSGPVKPEKYTQLLEAASASPTKVSMNSVVNALTYILRSAAALKLDGEEFQNQLITSDIFTKDVLDTLVHTWREQGRQLMETTSQLQCLNVGQLLDLQWRVGVAISSDDCKSLNSPHITLLLTIAETGGSITKHSVEMTLTQFRNFSRQLKEMAVLMETV